MYKILAILLLLSSITGQLWSQVTIGSGTSPINGALLQLKERESTDTDFSTASRGLSYPRVALTKTAELYPMYDAGYPGVADIAAEKKANTGLVVYNITENDKATADVDAFVSGLYVWDGSGWNLLQSSRVIEPVIDDLLCSSATLTPAAYTDGVTYKGVLKVPYAGGNGGFYEATPTIAINGLSFTLQSGKLDIGNGEIYYTVEGTPTVSSPTMTDVPISFLGQSCVASVGNVQEVKTISFAKTIATNYTTADIADKTVTTLGNLAVKIEYVRTTNFPANYSYFLTFRVFVPSHVTVLYTKSGKSVGYFFTGRKAAQDTSAWYRVKASAYFDDEWILEETASAGPTGSKDDLNPINRDIVQAIIMLHNTNEVYRVTINSNDALAALGAIQAVPPTVTLFLEKLD